MKKTARITTAERAGRWLGLAWRGCVRQEARAIRWLASKGLPTGLGRLLFWIVKIVVIGVLLYAAFWLALLLAFAVVAAWLARNTDGESDYPEPEWRTGPAGYGLYTYDGHRIDPHVHDDDA